MGVTFVKKEEKKIRQKKSRKGKGKDSWCDSLKSRLFSTTAQVKKNAFGRLQTF